MVAFIASLLVAVASVALVIPFAKRRPPGTPLTWGEAMVAATFIFFIFFWVYGVVPHMFLTWADNELKWRPDALTYEYWSFLGFLEPQERGGAFPMTINMQVIRDLLVVGIYVVFLGINIGMWAWWNNRGKRAEAAKEISTSDYGRPLVRKA